MRTKNPEFAARVRQYLAGQHFMKHIGFELNVIEEGRTEGFLDIAQVHKQQKGLVHGGVVATVADITAGFAAYTLVPADHHVVTAELKISYFKGGLGERLVSRGWVLKPGRKMNFCEAEVYAVASGKETLIAKATTTMATIFPEETARRNFPVDPNHYPQA